MKKLLIVIVMALMPLSLFAQYNDGIYYKASNNQRKETISKPVSNFMSIGFGVLKQPDVPLESEEIGNIGLNIGMDISILHVDYCSNFGDKNANRIPDMFWSIFRIGANISFTKKQPITFGLTPYLYSTSVEGMGIKAEDSLNKFGCILFLRSNESESAFKIYLSIDKVSTSFGIGVGF